MNRELRIVMHCESINDPKPLGSRFRVDEPHRIEVTIEAFYVEGGQPVGTVCSRSR